MEINYDRAVKWLKERFHVTEIVASMHGSSLTDEYVGMPAIVITAIGQHYIGTIEKRNGNYSETSVKDFGILQLQHPSAWVDIIYKNERVEIWK